MLGRYFIDEEIHVTDVIKQDFEIFKKFFWACLDKGTYLAPSPYETGFISFGHTAADVGDTVQAIGEELKNL
jgi:glutamate-1-semialdehyde 2,1-aminomutase